MEASDGDLSRYAFVRPLKPGSEFLCAVCLEVQREPRLLPCAHSFCLACLERQQPGRGGGRACAVCRTPYVISRTKRNRVLMGLFKELEVYCVATDQGCAWKDDFAALKKHEQDDCLFTKVKCIECNQDVLRGKQSDHKREQCPKRIVSCKFCLQPFPHDISIGHEEECQTRKTPCEFCQTEVEWAEMKMHRDTSCKVACSICGAEVAGKDFSQHFVSNNVKHGEIISKIRQDHQKEIKETREEIEQLKPLVHSAPKQSTSKPSTAETQSGRESASPLAIVKTFCSAPSSNPILNSSGSGASVTPSAHEQGQSPGAGSQDPIHAQPAGSRSFNFQLVWARDANPDGPGWLRMQAVTAMPQYQLADQSLEELRWEYHQQHSCSALFYEKASNEVGGHVAIAMPQYQWTNQSWEELRWEYHQWRSFSAVSDEGVSKQVAGAGPSHGLPGLLANGSQESVGFTPIPMSTGPFRTTADASSTGGAFGAWQPVNGLSATQQTSLTMAPGYGVASVAIMSNRSLGPAEGASDVGSASSSLPRASNGQEMTIRSTARASASSRWSTRVARPSAGGSSVLVAIPASSQPSRSVSVRRMLLRITSRAGASSSRNGSQSFVINGASASEHALTLPSRSVQRLSQSTGPTARSAGNGVMSQERVLSWSVVLFCLQFAATQPSLFFNVFLFLLLVCLICMLLREGRPL